MNSQSATIRISHRNRNPWTAYRQKQRRRRLEQKALHVEGQKKQLRALLKPKPWSEPDRLRLDKLKQLKHGGDRRSKLVKHASSEVDVPACSVDRSLPLLELPTMDSVVDNSHKSKPRSSKSNKTKTSASLAHNLAQNWEEHLHQHDGTTRTRFTVLLLLCLFVVLHLDQVLQRWYPWLFQNALLRIIVTSIHMVLCGTAHFILCDVTLLYAFASFEVTMKTGPRLQTYFREQLHGLVALGSASLVVLSVVHAVLLLWYRVVLWVLEIAYDVFMDRYYDIMDFLWDGWTALCSEMLSFVKDCFMVGPTAALSKAWNSFTKKITGLCFSIYALIMPFDEDERSLASRLYSIVVTPTDFVIEIRDRNSTTWDIDATTGEPATCAIETIRMDALQMCRALLSYSALFLIVVLVGVNILASSYRHAERPPTDATAEGTLNKQSATPPSAVEGMSGALELQSSDDQSTVDSFASASLIPAMVTDVSSSVFTRACPDRPETITISSSSRERRSRRVAV